MQYAYVYSYTLCLVYTQLVSYARHTHTRKLKEVFNNIYGCSTMYIYVATKQYQSWISYTIIVYGTFPPFIN